MRRGYVQNVRPCYNLHMTDRGVAYDFWLRVRAEQASRGWTDEELQAQSGIPRGTVARLASGKRRPMARTVNALAQALDIDHTEAHELAGRLPRSARPEDAEAVEPEPPSTSAREAILRDPIYTEQQRQAMLELLDIFEQANGRRQA